MKTKVEKNGGAPTRGPLASLPFGVQARVVAVNGVGVMARRMMEMGLVPGAPVSVVKAAPFGDPLHVRVRNSNLALRRSEADWVMVDTAVETDSVTADTPVEVPALSFA